MNGQQQKAASEEQREEEEETELPRDPLSGHGQLTPSLGLKSLCHFCCHETSKQGVRGCDGDIFSLRFARSIFRFMLSSGGRLFSTKHFQPQASSSNGSRFCHPLNNIVQLT